MRTYRVADFYKNFSSNTLNYPVAAYPCHSIGDHSQKSWDEAEGWQRQSAIKGVYFALANLGAPASAQHGTWLADKERDGWKYGAVKDLWKKSTHVWLPTGNSHWSSGLKIISSRPSFGRLSSPVARHTHPQQNMNVYRCPFCGLIPRSWDVPEWAGRIDGRFTFTDPRCD